MFDDVGQELKFRARARVWISTITYATNSWIISAIVAEVLAQYSPNIEGLKALLIMCAVGLFAFIGYFNGREKAILFYSYAELVDCAVKIQAHLEHEELVNAPTEPICEKCGSRYESDAKWCSNCGAMIKANHSTITDEDKRTAMINKWRESQLISDEEIKRRMGQ